jgi:pyridoxal phosphate enzyme (YggS family)
MPIRENIGILREKISKAALNCGRDPSTIIIVCVSKNRSAEDICEVLHNGINYIGENKVQEAQDKYSQIAKYASDNNIPLNFHMVGHLQTNKVSKALEMFNLIHSLDSLRLAQRINDFSKINAKVTDALVEVNISAEESKFGVDINAAIGFLKEVCGFSNICVRGLMAMAPLAKNKDQVRPYFRKLRQLKEEIQNLREPLFKDRIKMDFLSMGMSQDYEVAIEEGSNMLRIGTAIFKD